VIITMRWRRCADWSLRPEVMAINAGLLLMSSSISFEQETLVHFREEEEVVFPLVAGRPEAQDGLTRLLMEHARIHALVGTLRSELDKDGPSGVTMTATGGLLQALSGSRKRPSFH
jgi:Hemerythrin HHE cation binding domain